MLTPDERYEKILRDYHTSPHTMRELIIIAIGDAATAERERCACAVCPGCRAGYPLVRDGRDHQQPNGHVAGCAAYQILHAAPNAI